MKKSLKNSILLAFVVALISVSLGMIRLNNNSEICGTFTKVLTIDELTPKEQKDVPYLFTGDQYVEIKSGNYTYHAVLPGYINKKQGQSVCINDFFNGDGNYLVK